MFKKFAAALLVLQISLQMLGWQPALAMGSGNPFVDAQTGLTYVVYQPTNTLGIKLSEFKLLPCATTGDQWVAAIYGPAKATGKKKLEIYETRFDQKCSNPGLSKELLSVKIAKVTAKVYVYCDPSDQKKFKACSKADIAKVGGYLLFTTATESKLKNLKRTSIQVQGTGGITYEQLLLVANSLRHN